MVYIVLIHPFLSFHSGIFSDSQPDYRNYRSRWFLPKWVVAGTWLWGAWDYSANFNIQYRPVDHMQDPHKRVIVSALRRLVRWHDTAAIEEKKLTEIYNLGAQSHVGELWLLHGGFGRDGNYACWRQFGTSIHRDWSAVLPGWFFGDVWFGTASPTNRNNAVLSTQSICLCQGLCPLADSEL